VSVWAGPCSTAIPHSSVGPQNAVANQFLERKKHTQIITTDYPISDIYDVAFETNSKVKKINIIIMTKYGKKKSLH